MSLDAKTKEQLLAELLEWIASTEAPVCSEPNGNYDPTKKKPKKRKAGRQ